jgi:hypothetical protein
VFHNSDVQAMLRDAINAHALPNPNNDGQLLYMVIPQPGTSAGSLAGEHSYDYSTDGLYHYGWTINDGSLDTITSWFSHELVEAVTDPEGTAIQVNPRNAIDWNEIGDHDAQNYSYRLNNVKVQSYFSARDHAYIVPTGQTQNFVVSSSRALTVAGDQLTNPNDTITVDRSTANGVVVTLNGEMVQFDPNAITSITVANGTGTDTINVNRTLASAPLTVASNSGATVNIGNAASLQDVQGAVTLSNAQGSMTVNLDDSADPTNRTPTLDTVTLGGAPYGRVTGLAPAAIQYTTSNTGSVAIKTGSGGVTVTALGTGVPITLTGASSAPNVLAGPNAANTWRITGPNAGILTSTVTAPVTFASFQSLTGGSGTDSFVFSNGQGVSGIIRGGAGGEWLDYSAYASAVSVNLDTGQATGVSGGVQNIQNVVGGAGNDTLIGGLRGGILMGGAGTNILKGGTGRDLLIGGRGGSTITGGGDDDIVIAGTTSFDANEAALASLLAEWQRTDRGFQERITDLQTGSTGLNAGNHLLWGQTVFENGGSNSLTGGAGRNWYFTGNLGSIANPRAGDQFASPVDLVFVVGLDNQVYGQKIDAHGNPAWGYFLVQPGAVKAISPGRDGNGDVELFVIGLDDRVYAQKFDSNGNPVGGYLLTTGGGVRSISFAQDAFNRPEIFAIGMDGQVYVQKFDANGNSVSPYVLSRAGGVKSLGVGHEAANHPELFVIGLDNQVYAQQFDANGNSVSPYVLTAPGQVKSLSVGRDAGNRPELFVVGLDDQVYAQKFDANGNAVGLYFLTAAGQVKSVSVGRDASNRPELFVIGLDNQVYAQKFDDGGGPVGAYSLTTAGQVKSIKVGRDASNHPELFVIGLNDQVYAQEFDAFGNSNSPYLLTSPGAVKAYGVTR